MVDTSSLNENQMRSVRWGNGPVLIRAGPGSGKTEVLLHRISRIIKKTNSESFLILCLTFTNNAASEMQRRVNGMVPSAQERTLITTFHSFSTRILRQHGSHVGLRPDFTILSQKDDRIAILDDAIQKTRASHSMINFNGEQLLPCVDLLLNEGVTRDGAVGYLNSRKITNARVIGTIYSKYRHLMIERNEMDFGGLVAEASDFLQKKQAIRELIHSIYPYICVDEFQDTNLAQHQILRSIVNPSSRNLFLVADDDQVIYWWRGTSLDGARQFLSHYNMKILDLPESYRCPPKVIEIANKLISNNPSHDCSKPNLISRKIDCTGVVQVKSFKTIHDECDWIASDIERKPRKTRFDCAVLARNRKMLKCVIEALENRGVACHLAGRRDEFVSEPLKWLHSILQLANSRKHDYEQLRRACDSFSALVGTTMEAKEVILESEAGDGDYLRAWQQIALQKSRHSDTVRLLKESMLGLIDRLDYTQFIEASFRWFEHTRAEYESEKAVWREIASEITRDNGDDISLNTLLQEFALRSKEPPVPKDAVICHTIHGSKGLEFDHVYLAGLVEGELPIRFSLTNNYNDYAMQEERRLCFVAITRSQRRLTMTFSRDTSKPSRFLAEMGCIGRDGGSVVKMG